MTVQSLFEIMLSVTYINSVTHGAFYFEDYTFRPAFTFVDTQQKSDSEREEGPSDWFTRTHEEKYWN